MIKMDEMCPRCRKITKTVVISRGRLYYRACAKCGKPRRSQQPATLTITTEKLEAPKILEWDI